MLQIGDKVSPDMMDFPWRTNAPHDLHRNCIGEVVAVNGDRITVNWNWGSKTGRPQNYTYNSNQLMKI